MNPIKDMIAIYGNHITHLCRAKFNHYATNCRLLLNVLVAKIYSSESFAYRLRTVLNSFYFIFFEYPNFYKSSIKYENLMEVNKNINMMNQLKKTNCKILKLLIIFILYLSITGNKINAQSMGLSNTAITPDASSILEMRTTTKGLLIPRMTTTERDAISTPANGLMVYNTSTGKFNFYNGIAWTELNSGSGVSQNLQQVSDVGAITNNRITVNGLSSSNYIDYTNISSPASPGATTARMYSATDAGFTIMEVKAPSGQSFRFMRDNVIILKVKEAGGITAGQVVYLSGASGGNDECKLWIADGSINAEPIGVAVDAGSNNSIIRVMTLGKISELNTNSFTEGVSVYASASIVGGITSTQPTHPNLSTVVGIISRSHVSLGEITIVPFITKGNLLGTRQNDFSIGTNTTGAKTITLKNGFNGVLSTNPTANRTWTLPDATGTIALTSDGSPKWTPVTKSTSVALTNSENFVLGDCTSGNITLTLPASPTDGQEVVIIKVGTNENTAVTILPNSGQVIGQALTFWSLTERNHIVTFVYVSASTAWRITARSSFSALGFRKRGTSNARYYTSPNTGTALSTATIVANTLYAMPLVIENAVTIDQLLINVTTLGTGSSVRLGIYDDNNNSPDQLIVDAGAVTTATTGVKTYSTGLPISLPPGLYWVVAVCNTTAPVIRGFAVAGLIPIMGSDATLGTAQGLGYSVAFTYAALPSTFPSSPTVRTAAPLPAIFVRYSD